MTSGRDSTLSPLRSCPSVTRQRRPGIGPLPPLTQLGRYWPGTFITSRTQTRPSTGTRGLQDFPSRPKQRPQSLFESAQYFLVNSSFGRSPNTLRFLQSTQERQLVNLFALIDRTSVSITATPPSLLLESPVARKQNLRPPSTLTSLHDSSPKPQTLYCFRIRLRCSTDSPSLGLIPSSAIKFERHQTYKFSVIMQLCILTRSPVFHSLERRISPRFSLRARRIHFSVLFLGTAVFLVLPQRAAQKWG